MKRAWATGQHRRKYRLPFYKASRLALKASQTDDMEVRLFFNERDPAKLITCTKTDAHTHTDYLTRSRMRQARLAGILQHHALVGLHGLEPSARLDIHHCSYNRSKC